MFKVIVIDDEQLIRSGLKTIIDWNALGFEVTDDAAHGQEGFEKISKGHFDVAVVDIKMPVLDGLSMIEKLKTLGCSCQFILLTAYGDFKSAQQAIELGVCSYLLKPVVKKELIQKLLTLKEKLLEEQNTPISYEYPSTADIHTVISYIKINYAKNLKLDKLATQFGYNSTYLGKLLKKNTGYPFNTYLDLVRIQQAKKLLLRDLKVFEVCDQVGFCDTDYFTKKFKKYVGIPPIQYRKNLQEEHSLADSFSPSL
jgi:YesN/AraC family two-component response regulator